MSLPRSHAERQAAVAARHRELAAEVEAVTTALAAQAAMARDKQRTEAEKVEREAAQLSHELETELAASIRTKLFEVTSRFAVDPRRTSIEIVETWAQHAAAVRDALGEEPVQDVIVAAFLHAAGGEAAVARLGDPRFVLHHRTNPILHSGAEIMRNARDNFSRAFAGVGPAEAERLFRLLECDVHGHLDEALSGDVERAAAITGHVTAMGRDRALNRIAAERSATEQAAAADHFRQQRTAPRSSHASSPAWLEPPMPMTPTEMRRQKSLSNDPR